MRAPERLRLRFMGRSRWPLLPRWLFPSLLGPLLMQLGMTGAEAAAADVDEIHPPSISERIEAIRKEFRHRADLPQEVRDQLRTLAQWYNWPNWPNYWNNWGNWPNYWYNY